MLALTDVSTTMIASVEPDVKITQYVQWQYMNYNSTYWVDMPQWCSDLHEEQHLRRAAGFEYVVPYRQGRKLSVRFDVY